MPFKVGGQCGDSKQPRLCVDVDGELRAQAVTDPRYPDNTPYIGPDENGDGPCFTVGKLDPCPPGLDCLECESDSDSGTEILFSDGTWDTPSPFTTATITMQGGSGSGNGRGDGELKVVQASYDDTVTIAVTIGLGGAGTGNPGGDTIINNPMTTAAGGAAGEPGEGPAGNNGGVTIQWEWTKCQEPCSDTVLATCPVTPDESGPGGFAGVHLCQGDPCTTLSTEDEFGHAIPFARLDPGPESISDYWHCSECPWVWFQDEDSKAWKYCKCGPADECPEGKEVECADAVATWEATPDDKGPTAPPMVLSNDDSTTYAVLVPHCRPFLLPEEEWPTKQLACTGPAYDPIDGGPGACCACLCNEITITLNAGTFYLPCNEGEPTEGDPCTITDVEAENVTNIEWTTKMPYRGLLDVATGPATALACAWYNCILRYETNTAYQPEIDECDPEHVDYNPNDIRCQEKINTGCRNAGGTVDTSSGPIVGTDAAYNQGDVIGTGTKAGIKIGAAIVTAPISGVLSNNYSGQSPDDGKNLRDFVCLHLTVGCYALAQTLPRCNCWIRTLDPPACNEAADPNDVLQSCYETGHCTYDEDGNVIDEFLHNTGSATPGCCYCTGDVVEGDFIPGAGHCGTDAIQVTCCPLVNYCGGPSSEHVTDTICDRDHVYPPSGIDVNCVGRTAAGRELQEGVNDILISGSYYGRGRYAAVDGDCPGSSILGGDGYCYSKVCVGGTDIFDPCNQVELKHPWERCLFGGVIDTRIVNRTCEALEGQAHLPIPNGDTYECVVDPAFQCLENSFGVGNFDFEIECEVFVATTFPESSGYLYDSGSGDCQAKIECSDTKQATDFFSGSGGQVQGADCVGGKLCGYNAYCWYFNPTGADGTSAIPMTYRTGDGPTDFDCYNFTIEDDGPCGLTHPGSKFTDGIGCLTITAPNPCPEDFGGLSFYSPAPGVRPDQWADGTHRRMPWFAYPGYNWPRHGQGDQSDDYGAVCGNTACVNVECPGGQICTGVGCVEYPNPTPETYTGCCSSGLIRRSADNPFLIDDYAKLVFEQSDGFSGVEIACIPEEMGESELSIGAKLDAGPLQKITIVAEDQTPKGVTIKYKDQNGVVHTIHKEVKVLINGKPARMVPKDSTEAGRDAFAKMVKIRKTPRIDTSPPTALPSEAEIERDRPGIIQKAINLAKTLKQTGLKMVDADEAARRLSFCTGDAEKCIDKCAYFDADKVECRHPTCGCAMKRKTFLARAQCPINKW